MKWNKIRGKRSLTGLIAFLVLLPVAFYFWFLLFGRDYSISLPGGYSLIRVYAGAILMADKNHSKIISPNIDGYKVFGHIVIGHVSSDNLPPEEAADSQPGYFILDIQSGTVLQGLDEQRWLDLLQKYGITKKPGLHKPSRFDQIFSS